MIFAPALRPARLVRRYKRFLADVLLDGETLTVHCPNTGAMTGCAEPGSPVWLGTSASPGRKYRYTLELVETTDGTLVGVHTGRANALVEEAITGGVATALAGYAECRREVPYGEEGSRIDLLLADGPRRCFVEVKNVTSAVAGGIALFPDAVSRRAAKHLRELARIATAGDRAVVCFCVQRDDVAEVRPADAIDPDYGEALRAAIARGVETLAYVARVSSRRIALTRAVPVVCP